MNQGNTLRAVFEEHNLEDKSILDIEISGGSGPFNEPVTLKQYFKALLIQLVVEGERFSGKRPFGNGGWEFDLYAALIQASYVEGTLDEYNYVEECDTSTADAVLIDAILLL